MAQPSQVTGFDDRKKLPKDVHEEMESGRMAEISEKIGAFMREVDGCDECYLIVERGKSAIQYQVTLLTNGDIKVEIAEVPKKDRNVVVEPPKRGIILPA